MSEQRTWNKEFVLFLDFFDFLVFVDFQAEPVSEHGVGKGKSIQSTPIWEWENKGPYNHPCLTIVMLPHT